MASPILLSSDHDWRPWLTQIQVFAKSRAVWEYVDPESPNPKPLVQPTAPLPSDILPSAQTLRDLDNDGLTRWLLLNAHHNEEMRRHDKVREKLGDVHLEILRSVSRPVHRHLEGSETPRDAIVRLARVFGNRSSTSAKDISARWKKLTVTIPDGNLDTWLGMWHFLYLEGRKAGIEEVQKRKPVPGFLYAVDMIAPKFAFEWDCKIDTDDSIDLPLLLREFMRWKTVHPDLIKPKKHAEDLDGLGEVEPAEKSGNAEPVEAKPVEAKPVEQANPGETTEPANESVPGKKRAPRKQAEPAKETLPAKKSTPVQKTIPQKAEPVKNAESIKTTELGETPEPIENANPVNQAEKTSKKQKPKTRKGKKFKNPGPPSRCL